MTRSRRIFILGVFFSTQLSSAVLAQKLAQGDGVEVSIWRVVISLLFCFALAAGAIFALRRKLPKSRLFNRSETVRLKLVEHISLGPQRGVYLIELDDKEYLALFSQQSATLTPTNAPPSIASDGE